MKCRVEIAPVSSWVIAPRLTMHMADRGLESSVGHWSGQNKITGVCSLYMKRKRRTEAVWAAVYNKPQMTKHPLKRGFFSLASGAYCILFKGPYSFYMHQTVRSLSFISFMLDDSGYGLHDHWWTNKHNNFFKFSTILSAYGLPHRLRIVVVRTPL